MRTGRTAAAFGAPTAGDSNGEATAADCNRSVTAGASASARHLSTAPFVLLLALWGSGCGRTQTADQALDKAYATTGGAKTEIGKVAGTVTIDGQPAGDTGPTRLLVILYNPRQQDGPKKAPIYAVCDEEGRFAFNTYSNGDGVPPGKYVALFAQLKISPFGDFGYDPPDALQNLYNDPDKNAAVPEFNVEVTSGGKTDYHFDLKVQGQEPVPNPGTRAVTSLH